MKKNKSKLKIKAVLFAILAIVLMALVVIYAFVTRNDKGREETTVPTPIETSAEALTEAPTEAPTTIPPTTAIPTTVAPNKTGVPTIVSPTGDKWFLTIVNMDFCLPEGYTPKLAPSIAGSKIQLDERVAPFYQQMYDAAKIDGLTLTPYSGYRSYDHQKRNYNNNIAYLKGRGYSEQDAINSTKDRIMPPGHSEHNMGFAMDIVSASSDFMRTKEYSWLLEHAQDYGFILRYSEDKVKTTKVVFEPWHWRFVGVEMAKEIKASGKCLEEFLNLA
ncbi:MAG: M15 family metallopeptidase [Oscillospiraceae bacterium]